MTGKIKLELQTDIRKSKVFIDDKEIHGVTSIKFEQSVDTIPVAEIKVICKEVEVDTKGLVEYVDESVNDKTVDYWLKKNCPGSLVNTKFLKELNERGLCTVAEKK